MSKGKFVQKPVDTSQLVVTTPKEPIVASQLKPTSILKPSKYIAENTDSIAARVKSRQILSNIPNPTSPSDTKSFAEHVKE